MRFIGGMFSRIKPSAKEPKKEAKPKQKPQPVEMQFLQTQNTHSNTKITQKTVWQYIRDFRVLLNIFSIEDDKHKHIEQALNKTTLVESSIYESLFHSDVFNSALSVHDSTNFKEEIIEESKEVELGNEEEIQKESKTARLTGSSNNISQGNKTVPIIQNEAINVIQKKDCKNVDSKLEYISKFAGWIETFTLKMQDIENEHEILQMKCKEITALQKEAINKSILPTLISIIANYQQFKKLADNELNQFDMFDQYMQTTIAGMATDICSINKTKKGAKVAGFTLATLSLLLIPVSIPFVIGALASGVGAAAINSKEGRRAKSVTMEMNKASLFEEAFKEKKEFIRECKGVISSYIDHLISIKNDLESDSPVKDTDIEYIRMYTPLKPEDLIVQKLA